MKSVQKFGSLLLAALMILSLTACGSKTNNTPAQTPSNDTPAESTPSETPDDATAGDSDSTTSGGKVLVVYYSASGNTKRVAEDIAEAADGDLFEITPAEPYTSDDLNWTNSDSRVSREHDDESLRDVPLTTTEVENWDDYDTVFIGYPIWWGIAAWPVDTFVKNNDFTGKTVIRPPAWARAVRCSPKWRVPATGRTVSASPAAPARAMWPIGSAALA